MRDLITGVAIYRNDEWKIPFLKEEGGSTDGENGNGNNTNNRSGDKMNVDDGKNNEESKESGDDEGQTSDEDETYEVKCKKYYNLPDRTRINLQTSKEGKDLSRLNELLFASSLPFADEHVRTLDSSTASTLSDLPIHELIRESLTAVSDADIRKELCGNIILTGAASLIPNIEARLSLEVQHLVPGMYKCKVIATKNSIERRYSSFIGGSILSSLGSFQQLWLGKKEYEEYGMTLASQRFP